ncbi:hypothetical protein [Streptomyces sp. NPDC093568]|uniref:hypothetical protein n=1 Tax=Streptomyces sp. NPDC093568 TaxID=3366041 RepID=UPI0037F3B7BE
MLKDRPTVRAGRLARVGVAVACLVLTSACGEEPAPPVTDRQVIGDWSAACGATIRIAADHTFRFTGFPIRLAGRTAEPERTSGDGKWSLYPGKKGVAPPTLDLDGERSLYSLDYVHDGKKLKLHWSVGDPDEGFHCTFVR